METDNRYKAFGKLIRRISNISTYRVCDALQRIRNRNIVAEAVRMADEIGIDGRKVRSFKTKVAKIEGTSSKCHSEIVAAMVSLFGIDDFPDMNKIDRLTDRVTRISDRQRLVRNALSLEAFRTGSKLPPRVSADTWHDVDTFSVYVFSTQTDPGKYVRALAMTRAKLYRSLGVPTTIVARGKNVTTNEHDLVVRCRVVNNVDVEILVRRQWPTGETVRLLWAHGANPRVPGLPVSFIDRGYEDEIGIDYFGHIVDHERYEHKVERFLAEAMGVGANGHPPTRDEIAQALAGRVDFQRVEAP